MVRFIGFGGAGGVGSAGDITTTNAFTAGQFLRVANAAGALEWAAAGGGGSFTGNTDDIPEGATNLFFTQTRARSAVSAAANSMLAYSSSTGVFSISGTAFNEAVDDRVNALIVAGTGISKSYNDSSGSLTLSVDLADDSVDNAAMADDAVDLVQIKTASAGASGNFLQRTSSGLDWATPSLTIGDGTITNAKLADDAVGLAEIDTASTGTAGQYLKRTSNGLDWDSPTFTIADNSITNAKMADSAIDLAEIKTTNTGSSGQVLSRTSNALSWITVSQSSGSTTLGGLSDVNIPDSVQAGLPLLATVDSTWTPGDMPGTAITSGTIPIRQMRGLTTSGTDGQLVASDGTGGVKFVSASSIGLSSFPEIAGTLNETQDGFLMFDGSNLGRQTLQEVNYVVEPIHLQDVSLTGYSMVQNANPSAAGQARLLLASGIWYLYMIPNSGDLNALNTIFSPGFDVGITKTTDTGVNFRGRIQTRTTLQNTIFVAAFATDTEENSGTFATGDTITFRSYGRHVPNENVKHSISGIGSKFDVLSTAGIVSWNSGYWRDNSPALQYEATLPSFLVTGGESIEGNGDMKIATSTRTWTLRMTAAEWAGIDPVCRVGSRFRIIDNSDSSVRQSGVVESVDRTVANAGSDRVVTFVYETGATGNIADGTEIDDVNLIFEAAQTAANREWIQDMADGFIGAGTGLSKTYNDSGNALTLSVDFADSTEGNAGTSLVDVMSPRRTADYFNSRKATGSDLADDNTTHWMTPEEVDRMIGSAAKGQTFTLTFETDGGALGANLSNGQIAFEPGHESDFQFNVKTTDAVEDDMDVRLRPGAPVRIQQSAQIYVEGFVWWAAHSEGSNLFSFAIKSSGRTNAGTFADGASTDVTAEGKLRQDLIDGEFLTYDSIVAGENVTKSALDSNKRFTLSAAGGGGGGTLVPGSGTTLGGIRSNSRIIMNNGSATLGSNSVGAVEVSGLSATSSGFVTVSSGSFSIGTPTGGGALTYATDAQALAGTSRNLPINPANLRAVARHFSHTSQYSGFVNTANTGASMPLGSWNINSTGTLAYYRAHNADEYAALQGEMLADEDMRMVNATDQVIGFQFASVSVHAIDGSDVGYIRCVIGRHYAHPNSPTLTGNWTLYISPKQNREVLQNAPEATIPLMALATIPAGQLQGLSAAGNNGIGTTTFGTISDTDFASASLSPTRAGLLPIPHPNSASTPAGTGERTFRPKSAASTFLCIANVGFGWVGSNTSPKVHFILARRVGGSGGTWVVANKKENVVNGTAPGGDINVTPFAVDAPNTTQEVTYRWMIVRGNTTTIYPISQSVAFAEVTNL